MTILYCEHTFAYGPMSHKMFTYIYLFFNLQSILILIILIQKLIYCAVWKCEHFIVRVVTVADDAGNPAWSHSFRHTYN